MTITRQELRELSRIPVDKEKTRIEDFLKQNTPRSKADMAFDLGQNPQGSAVDTRVRDTLEDQADKPIQEQIKQEEEEEQDAKKV